MGRVVGVVEMFFFFKGVGVGYFFEMDLRC